jgi:hypothetical protein
MQQLEECPTQWTRATPSPRSSSPQRRACAAMLTVERRWTAGRYASWVTDLLDHDLLG